MNNKIRFWHIAASIALLGCGPTASAQQTTPSYSGATIASEGAWCWFADPRAMHYTSPDGSVDASYVGYIDVHGNVKASMFDSDGRQSDVLVRSYFQPDDHNNPTFLALPDKRIMIFYTRHTDEARFYYRISQKPGDITSLGEEKIIKVANNTTYPSPFILSDDPDHIYLCWRGIGWHPTIAKLSMPDRNDDVKVEYGPYQMVQSTGSRPYAKYQSNGKDKIYVSYTTGHPDNEYPNWLYFNVININAKKAADGTVQTTPQLCDLKGKVLSTIANGKFNVSKTSSYQSSYPNTIIDAPSSSRDWVWQITLDKNQNPVVAMVRITNDKKSHEYYYARWNGSKWNLTDLANGGGSFHGSNTEYCYSGGMAIDPDTVGNVYLSIPTANETSGNKVYEIWKYTIDEKGSISSKQQVTRNSSKNNVRPFILPGSAGKRLRLCWMNGDYSYWIVCKNYPKGYPTAIHGDFKAQAADNTIPAAIGRLTGTRHMTAGKTETVSLDSPVGKTFTIALNWQLDETSYGGTMLKTGNLEYGVDPSTLHPYVTVAGKTYSSQCILGTSDAWANNASGTDGKWYMSKLKQFSTAITYDGSQLTVYRNGWIDQRIDLDGALETGDIQIGGFDGTLYSACVYGKACNQSTVRAFIQTTALDNIEVPDTALTDIVLPQASFENQSVTWSSDHEDIITPEGFVRQPEKETVVNLTATLGGNSSRTFRVRVMPRDIKKNLRATTDRLDLSDNTATGFATNKYATLPEGLLPQVRSYTALLKVNAASLDHQPRFYDLGSAASNSLFLRANPLSAGIKYNGGATTLVNAPEQLTTNRNFALAVTFDAETQTTRIFVDGKEAAQGTANTVEPWLLTETAADSRNYLGRTQWWDSNYANDNADFKGVISDFRFYDIDLSRREICQIQGIDYEEEQLPDQLANGDFEAGYTPLANSGVKADRAIYKPKGWTIDYSNMNENDLTGLKTGDLYFSNFFSTRPRPQDGGMQTYWIRQNWGASTITLSQKVLLPKGEYVLSADVWKSGLGGDVSLAIQTEGGLNVKAPALSNMEQWQKVKLAFSSDGTTPQTVQLAAIHTASGSEKIIGFDNVSIVKDGGTGLQGIACDDSPTALPAYTLGGWRVDDPTRALPRHSVYIQNGKKRSVK